MLEQIANYLEKIGYTAEQQGSIEKYLVVFLKGRPLGFILADGSVRLVSGAEGADDIRQILAFLDKNKNLKNVGNGELLVGEYRGHQLTTFYDVKDRMERFAVYIREDDGKVGSTIFDSEEKASYRFITQSRMFDLKKYLPRKESFMNRVRAGLIRHLMSKSGRQAEQP